MELYQKTLLAILSLNFSAKLSVFILLNAAAILWFSMRRAAMRPGLPLLYLGLVALAIYTQFGQFYQALPARAPSAEETTAKPRESLVNFFALYNTYLASKYFTEVGYTGLHSSVAYADAISGAPLVFTNFTRNLQVPETVVPMTTAIAEGREIYRPRFSEDRWEEFTEDASYLRQIGFPGWLNQSLHGVPAQYSPLWMHLGGVLSKYLPLSEPWAFDQTMDSSEIIPLLDVALLASALLFVWLGFGLSGMGLTLVFLGISAFSTSATLGGGYFELAWFSAFAVGLSLVNMRHSFLGGLFISLAACMNGFLFVFAVAALACLLLQRVQKIETSHKPWLFFLLAAMLMTAVLLSGSAMRVGSEVWQVYFKMLLAHDERFLVGSIGHKIFSVFDAKHAAEILPDNPISLTDWANYSYTTWRKLYPILWVPCGLMAALSFWAARRTGLIEGILLIGTVALFFYGNLPKSSYIFLALLPATLARPAVHVLRRRVLLGGFTLCWLLGVLLPIISQDVLLNDYLLSAAVLALLTLWLFSAAISKPFYASSEAVNDDAAEAQETQKPSLFERFKSFFSRKKAES